MQDKPTCRIAKLNNLNVRHIRNGVSYLCCNLKINYKNYLPQLMEKRGRIQMEDIKPSIIFDERINSISVSNMKDLFLNEGISSQDRQFIGTLSPFIKYPNNDILVFNEYLTLENLGKFIGISKNIITKVVKNLQELNVINVVSGGKNPPTIYFNPNLISSGECISCSTIEMFDDIAHSERAKKLKFNYTSKKYKKDKQEYYHTEKDIEKYLSENLNIIEEGLTLIKQQYKVENGYIDILARDKNNVICIIEIKKVDNDKSIVEQCVYYPSEFDEETRMIAIAPSYKDRILKALTSLKYVEIRTYQHHQDGRVAVSKN